MLDSVKQTIQHWVDSLGSSSVKDYYTHISSGKMLRTRLVDTIAHAHPDAVKLAAVIETIHLSSLLHDDVIDDAELRRGSPSINALYSAKHAVMLGDIFYSKAYSELVALGAPIAQIVADSVTKLSLGELMDVEMGEQINTDEMRYLEMIYLKTGALIEATTHTAALLVDKDPEMYRRFGLNLGVSFQIIDDILDITQDEATLGKPAMSDFKEGKTTLPYIYLYETLDDAGRQRLEGLFKQELCDNDIVWLHEMFHTSGALQKSIAKAQQLVDEALLGIDDPALHELMKKMISRTR